jgi:probable rRNA maturation factor
VRERAIYLSPWRIDITVRDGVVLPGPVAGIVKAVAAALNAAGAPDPGVVELILTDDGELAELNETHLGERGPTDVLSFPLLPPESFPPHTRGTVAPAAPAGPAPFVRPPGRRANLGAIVVSVERAAAQAASGRGGQTGDVRWSPADEILLLVTHGALHICGWDHVDPAEEAAMRALERRLLAG